MLLQRAVARADDHHMSEHAVKRWARYGHDRLYVEAPDGTRLGYWDLRTGQAVVEDDTHREAVETATARLRSTPAVPVAVPAQAVPVKVPAPLIVAYTPALPVLTSTPTTGVPWAPAVATPVLVGAQVEPAAIVAPAVPAWTDLSLDPPLR